MIGATLVAAVVASVIDLAIQFWFTPFGWSAGVAFGLFAIGALIGFLVSAALGVVVGLPLGRLLARQGKFEPASLIIVGALLGVLAATIFSALGNTYDFMSGIGFWKSFVVDGTMGALIGHFWWVFEKRSLRRGKRTLAVGHEVNRQLDDRSTEVQRETLMNRSK
jgi:hypothetical protein